MSKLSALDLAFLALENSSRQTHMAAFQLFKLPATKKRQFIDRLLAAYRDGAVAKPFDQKLKWMSRGVASWQYEEPDLKYHVRHIAVPPPGSMSDFYQIISFLNSSLLDRNKPLWECYVIEGIEDDRIAVFIKVHHAMIDGMGAMRLFENSLSTNAKEAEIRAVWSPIKGAATRRAPRQISKKGASGLEGMLSRLSGLSSSLLDTGRSIADLGAQNLSFKPKKGSLPFRAQKTLFNNTAQTSERRYANCELPLADIKHIAQSSGTTVNDVVMTIIDEAMNRYLDEKKASASQPLVTMMAMSLRAEGGSSTGNQVSVELVPMGEPSAKPKQRLQQIHDSATHIKDYSATIPNSVRQLYSLIIFGGGVLPEIVDAFQSIPNANMLISNMIGPREQLYLGGAPLLAFHGLPIVPPGCGVNVTFATIHQTICLGVGAAPEAIEDPYHLTELITKALSQLFRSHGGKSRSTTRKARAKTARTKPKSRAKSKAKAKPNV